MANKARVLPSADVIVIGGGLIGCAIAFRLAQARLTVAVLDRGEPGAEASQAAAGMLAPQGEIAEPTPFFQLCAASRDLYPSLITETENATGRSVPYYRDGSILVAVDDDQGRALETIYNNQKKMGLAIERLSRQEVSKRVPGLGPAVQCGAFILGDHWVDNEQLVRVLVESCRALGVRFYPGSRVTRIITRNSRVQSVQVEVSSGVHCHVADQFILAAGSWSGELVAQLGIELGMQPCRGQMIELESDDPWPVVVRAGHFYLVPRPPGRLLAGTTVEYAGFEKVVTAEGLRSILEGVSRFAPLGKLRFRRAWCGLRPDTRDHLPILGYGELENLIFATGHFRNGILLAPLTAQLVSELLLTGSASRDLAAYSPTRFARRPT